MGGGGGEYSYIRVLPDEFLLKSVVFKFISREISRAEHEYMNIQRPPPPFPPIKALVSPMHFLNGLYRQTNYLFINLQYSLNRCKTQKNNRKVLALDVNLC